MTNFKDSFNQNPSQQEADAFIKAAAAGDNTAVTAFTDKYPKSVDTLNFRTYVRKTALMAAAEGGHKDIVEFLLKRGALIDRKNDMGATALSYAASSGETEIADLLLREGASMNAGKTEIGEWTVLMSAAWNMHVDTVKLLLEKGASVSEKDFQGKTVLEQAREHLNDLIASQSIESKIKSEWLEKSRQIVEILEKGLEAQSAAPKKSPVKKFKF